MRSDWSGLLLGHVEALAHVGLVTGESGTLQGLWSDVDLQVELTQLGLEVGVGDAFQHLGVLQRRVAGVVDQVELDLETGALHLGVEPRLA
jgi:hypothetical protein